jgi:hypothetical protein
MNTNSDDDSWGKPIPVWDYEYNDYRENYIGFCTTCSAFDRESTEPDAEGYDCDECENQTVIGVELALVLGLIEVVESKESA